MTVAPVFQPGARVELVGLKTATLNGCVGTCGDLNDEGTRITITLDSDGRQLAIKLANLSLSSTPAPALSAKEQERLDDELFEKIERENAEKRAEKAAGHMEEKKIPKETKGKKGKGEKGEVTEGEYREGKIAELRAKLGQRKDAIATQTQADKFGDVADSKDLKVEGYNEMSAMPQEKTTVNKNQKRQLGFGGAKRVKP